jgi:hypothetical protein
MEEKKMKPDWQQVEDVNWDEFEKAISNSRTKQQIVSHLRHLIERKGYANMLRAAEVAFNRLVEVLPGNKGSIGVQTYIDGKEIYANFRFVPTGGKPSNDEFNY